MTKKKSWWHLLDEEAKQPPSMSVHEEDGPKNTGVLDQFGNPIVREKQRIGFGDRR